MSVLISFFLRYLLITMDENGIHDMQLFFEF